MHHAEYKQRYDRCLEGAIGLLLTARICFSTRSIAYHAPHHSKPNKFWYYPRLKANTPKSPYGCTCDGSGGEVSTGVPPDNSFSAFRRNRAAGLLLIVLMIK
jgi:hypothetical protein